MPPVLVLLDIDQTDLSELGYQMFHNENITDVGHPFHSGNPNS
jgi:hypothetical protein